MVELNFHSLFRKHATLDTLSILSEQIFLTETEFFNKLKSSNSYENSYYRVKDAMLFFKLIEYSVTTKGIKLLAITPKGRDIWNKIVDIEAILDDGE